MDKILAFSRIEASRHLQLPITGLPDNYRYDTGLPDNYRHDTGLPDNYRHDTGLPDNYRYDTGLPDNYRHDTGLPDNYSIGTTKSNRVFNPEIYFCDRNFPQYEWKQNAARISAITLFSIHENTNSVADQDPDSGAI